MKFASSLVFAAAAATAVLAAPRPQEDGGQGIPPPATLSTTTTGTETTGTETTTSTATPTGTEVPEVPKGEHQPDIQIPFSTSNALFTLTPADADSWAVMEAPGVFNVSAHFAVKNQDKAGAKFEAPQAFAGLQVWMYQRSDGGVASLLIDGVALARLDYYNKTAGKDDPPVMIYENPHLRRDHHVLEFRNVEDPRVKKFGQFNIDHITITAEADAPTEEVPPTTSAPEPEPSTKDAPPLTAPTAPTAPQEQTQSQTTPPPGSFAHSLSAPKAVLSVATLVAAALALF